MRCIGANKPAEESGSGGEIWQWGRGEKGCSGKKVLVKNE